MRKIEITEYGKRYAWLNTNMRAGYGRVTHLHFPQNKNISMKLAISKMLFLINLNKYKTRKEIFEFYKTNELVKAICNYGNSFTPFIDHYWSDLHRNRYICQYRDGKKIVYSLTEKGEQFLTNIPFEEKRIFNSL